MLKPETLAFLADLKVNNNKPWFDAARPMYDAARADFIQFVSAVLDGLGRMDPAIAASDLQPKACIFRINRDIRFARDKSPYKSNFGAWFNAGGKNSASAGYYVNLEPGDSFVAGGLYMPEPTVLTRVRQEIDYDLPAFEAILAQPTFTSYFAGLDRENALQRPPKGYEADNPAIEYLKMKSFTAVHRIPDAQLTQPDLLADVLGAYRGLLPLVHFLNRSLD